MKKIFNNILIALAASVFVVSACDILLPEGMREVEDVYTPGEADASGCAGVYFPVQTATGSHELDPTDPTEVTFSVARTNSSGAISVPVVLTSDTEGIFTAGALQFDDGQSESTLRVTFPDAEPGITYSVDIAVTDPQYASKYNTGATSISYSVTRVKWNELGTGKWREDILAGTISGYVSPLNPVWDVTVYERDDMPGMFRVTGVYTDEQIYNWLAPSYKQYRSGVLDDLIIVVDASNPNKVWIPYTFLGWQFYSNGPFYIGSRVAENVDVIGSSYISDANYGTYKDGIVTFPYRALCYGFAADDWWGYGNTNEMFYFAIPGATPVDYSIKIQSDLTSEGVTPIYVTAGMDVTELKYAVYEGELNAAQAANKAQAIIDGTDPSSSFTDLKPNSVGSAKVGTMGVAAEETGVYSVVVVTYDAEGKAHNSAYTDFTYVSPASPVPVVINCGLEVTGKYEARGYTKENSLEFYVYGEDIVDAKVGVYKKIDIVSKGTAAIVENLMGKTSLSAEAIEAVNGTGYVGVATSLIPGTEFYLFVWASNGYEDTVIMSDPATTEGDPLPIYQEYTTANYYPEGALSGRDDIIGTWNYYGTDAYGSLGMREYLGKVTVTASESPTEGPDDDGLYDEYVYVSGLFGDLSWLARYGMSTKATVEMDVYGGIMYQFGGGIVDGSYKVYLGAKAQNEWGYNLNYGTAFIPVADGYYAFVDVSRYAASYNFCGLSLLDPDAGWIAKIWDPLLVDPAKDDNGLAGATVETSKTLFKEAVVAHNNLVESDKGRIEAIIDQYKNTVRSFTLVEVEGAERTPRQVKATVVSLDKQQPVEEAPQGAPGFLKRVER